MYNDIPSIPQIENEPVYSYAPDSTEKVLLKAKLKEFAGNQIEIPLVIGGREVQTGDLAECIMPHNHKHVLAKYHRGNEEHVAMAVAAAAKAKRGLGEYALGCARIDLPPCR